MTKCGRAKLQYMVGGLLYSPAINIGLAEKIENNFFPCLTSMAFCLEDSIRDEALEESEIELCNTLEAISKREIPGDRMPLLFVRIRDPEHMRHIHEMLKAY